MIVGALAKPPRFLTEEEVLTLHELAIHAFGGKSGLRDRGVLLSAITMPQQGLADAYAHSMPFGMAAAYTFHLAKNHPFIDGNKRVAFAAAATFLYVNGWALVADEDDAANQVLAVVTGSLSKELLEAWIQAHVRPRPTLELRDFFSTIRYKQLAESFSALADGPQHERVASILEASGPIPAINEGNIGAVAAEQAGHAENAAILRHHTLLLTVLYRVAEDRGYEW
jgi:death on curing protein